MKKKLKDSCIVSVDTSGILHYPHPDKHTRQSINLRLADPVYLVETNL